VRRLELCDPELRGWEWRHLRLTADSSLWHSVIGEERAAIVAVTDVAVSPDGSRIAAATGAKTIQLLRTADGEVLDTIGEVPATSLDWTPDGALLVAGCGDRRIRVFDPSSGALVRDWRAHRSHVQEIAVSPDGDLIASASGDKLVKIWTLEGQLVKELEGHTSRVTCVAWDPSGARLASGSRDRTVRTWDVATGAAERVITGHRVAVGAVAFGPAGALLASTALDIATGRLSGGPGEDSPVLVWDANTGERVAELRGHTDGIPSVDFAPDGRLVTASLDGTVRVWDPESGDATVLLGHREWVTCASFSPDGQLVVSGAQDLTVRLWDPAAATGLTLVGHPRTIVELIAYDRQRLLSISQDGSIRLWDTRSGEQLHVLRGHDMVALGAAFAPANGRLVTVGGVSLTGFTSAPAGKHGYLWDLATRTRLKPLEGGELPVTCVAITPDGSTIATGSADPEVVLWDGRTGERTRVLEGHQGLVSAVAIHPAGQLVVSDGSQHTYAWDLATGEPTDVLGDAGGTVRRMGFSQDGERLLTCLAGTLVALWRTDGFEQLMTLRGHAGGVSDAVFSPDGERIATCSEDGTVRLWDPETGEQLLSLQAPRGNVKRLAFSPDGEDLIGGYDDGRVHVWTARVGPERSAARRLSLDLRARAQPLLAAAFEREVEPERVVAMLRGDRTLDGDVREAAIRMAEAVEESPIQTEDEVWMVVRKRFAPTAEYERALWKARLAAARNEHDEQPLRLVGMALYRTGRYEEALEVLERSHAERIATRRARPEVAAFLAMTHHRLGQEDQARQYLELIRGLMQISTLQANSDSVAFLKEAESLMAYR
jgi:WD40 repeat protein